MLGRISAKGDNYCDFLLDYFLKSLLKKDLLKKKIICSSTHLSLASQKGDIGKQQNAASDQDLHCLHSVQIFLPNMIIIKLIRHPLYRKWTCTKS